MMVKHVFLALFEEPFPEYVFWSSSLSNWWEKSLENEFFMKSALRDQKGAAYPYNQNQG